MRLLLYNVIVGMKGRKMTNNTKPRKKKKNRSGMELSAAIVIINVLIAMVLILLIVLIYMHLNGQIDVEKSKTEGEQTGTVTAITTVAPETTASERTTPDDYVGSDDASLDGDDDAASETTTTPPAGDGGPVDSFASVSYANGFYDNSLFIGDSISTGLVGYGYLETKNVFAQVGLNPESVFSATDDNGDTAISRAAALQPDRIYIMLGSNGLAFMGTSYMSEKISKLVDTLAEGCPSSELVVISITPVTAAHEAEGNEVMADINEYNSLLSAVCKDKSIKFIDLCSHFKNSDGYFASTYAEVDGLHFLGTAYTEMLNYIFVQLS